VARVMYKLPAVCRTVAQCTRGLTAGRDVRGVVIPSVRVNYMIDLIGSFVMHSPSDCDTIW